MELQTNALASAFGWIVFFCLVGFVFYAYFAVTLMIIARKTKTPGAGMAWIPVLNLYLMCQIGRRPAWWMLLFFVPLINLFALAMIWMSIAEMCRKPAWTGALVIIPFVGLIIPAYLALGAKLSPALTLGARNCQSCRTSIVADETFCRNCGDSAATVVAAHVYRTDKGDGGYIIRHESGRFLGTAFEVSGCMFKIYASIGNTKSWLGFPIKDGTLTEGGARQDFEGGYVLWDSKTYNCQAYKN